MQPGFLINLERLNEVKTMLLQFKWEPMCIFRNRKVYTSMVGEFYCNMGIGKGVNDTLYITSVVGGKPILLDHFLIRRALQVEPQVVSLPRIDISKEFAFGIEEYHLFISTLCGTAVPEGRFMTDKGISSDHFLPQFQIIAMVIRANILPKMTPDKMFNFVELKLIYLLFTRRIYFSLPYVILVNMVHASKTGYMPYGLLLTAIFKFMGFDMTRSSYYVVQNTLSEGSIKAPVPLEESEPVQEIPVGLPNSITSLSSFCAKVDELSEDLKVMKTELKSMSDKNEQFTARVDFLMASLAESMARMNVMEHSINQLVQAQYELTSTPAPHGDTGEREEANGTVNACNGNVEIKIEK